MRGSDGMDAVALLKKFAKSKGIKSAEVDKFLLEMSSPKTLDELEKLPTDMLNHMRYLTEVEEPLRSFIDDNMYLERHMTVDLEDIAELLEDAKYNAEEDDKTDELKRIEEVEKFVIESKFGSVVCDW